MRASTGGFAVLVGVWLLGQVTVAPAGPMDDDRPVFELRSTDGRSALQFQFAAQFRWEYNYFDRGGDPGWASRNRLFFRRLRPVVRGKFLGGDLTWLLHLNLVPGATELMDLWIGFRFTDQLRVQLGQAKVPYTRYRLNSFQHRPVVEWSYDTWYFGCERQIGITFHNGMSRPPPLEYQVGVYTGVNARASNGVGMARVYAAPRPSPSSLADPAPLDAMHTEIAGHLAYNTGDIVVGRPSDLEGGPPRFSFGLSAAIDLDPVPRQDMRLRIAPEVEARLFGLALTGVFHLGLVDEVVGNRSFRPGVLGGLAQASYVFCECYEVALRYSVVHILGDLRRDARAWADAEIATADDAARADLVARHIETGRVLRHHEVDLGFNWYLYSTTLKWQVDVGWLLHEHLDGKRHEVQVRSHVQVAF